MKLNASASDYANSKGGKLMYGAKQIINTDTMYVRR